MKEGKKLIVTIGRQYGSGGSEIGARLAKELGIHFYDKNILRMNSDQSGIMSLRISGRTSSALTGNEGITTGTIRAGTGRMWRIMT